jgi:hypothetical protein
MAYVWAEKKPETKKLVDAVIGIDSFASTYNDCPPTATIVFGRLFMAKFRSTFRAAENGDRMIAVEGVGKTQYTNGGGSSFFMTILYVILVLALLGGIGYAIFYCVQKKKAAGSEAKVEESGDNSGQYY